MKLLRYCIVTALIITSTLCQGFSSSTLKHVGQGLGATGLGFMSAYVAGSVLLADEKNDGTYKLHLLPKIIKRTGLKLITCNNGSFDDNFKYLLGGEVTICFGLLSLLGLSTYGASKSFAYAYQSFKKAYTEKDLDATELQSQQLEDSDEKKEDFAESVA